MIVDIGGGTTDIAVMRFQELSAINLSGGLAILSIATSLTTCADNTIY